jgi:putative ABC transport system permease protein
VQAYATDIDSYLDAIPDYKVPAEQREAMHRTRMGAIVGAQLAKRFNWHIGDRITLHSSMWMNSDGSWEWPLDIVGLANAGPEDDRFFANDLIFNYDYLDAARTTGKGMVNHFVVALDAGARASDVAIAIDQLFANSGNETSTVNEQEMIAAIAGEVGDLKRFVDSIIGAVVFTLLFLAGSTMSQSVRDRLPEFAVLKAVGFGGTSVWLLVVAEASVLSLGAAVVGLAIAAAVFPTVFASLTAVPVPLSSRVYLGGFAIALLLAVTSATIPALRARRLSVVDALSGR